MDLLELERLDGVHAESVRALLADCGDEFVPPLSTRHSTSQSNLGPNQPQGDGVSAYFEEMRRQPIILALEGSTLVGFLSYIPGFSLDFLPGPSCYVSTICVSRAHRCRGIASALYQRMEELARPGIVSLRTWSTNHVQIAVLKRRGYDCVKSIADDRGEGIDTVYFAKSLG